jgi:acyl carrier protein
MPEIRQRLTHCFATVFPDLGDGGLQSASHTSVANWDSFATIRLIAVVEEEFNVSIPLEDLEYLVSFEMVLDCVRRRIKNAS